MRLESLKDVMLEPGQGGFRGETLDKLLATGFHRNMHCMYQTHLHFFGMDRWTPMSTAVFKIRYELDRYTDGGTARKILRRGSRFEVSFQPGGIDAETEELYARYLASVTFETAPSCREYLHDADLPDPFDTEMVQVRDDGRLVAAGYCDRGRESMMGVLNFYDPEYAGYSPGKLMFLRMIHHAIEGGLRYFYPGSLLVDDDRLDYKMFAGRGAVATFLPVEEEWRDYSEWDKRRMGEYFRSHAGLFYK
jgi:arginyl-tRNA--protein-N-Asp/Glu arginylyltransferase